MEWFIAADSSCDLYPRNYTGAGLGINPEAEACLELPKNAPEIGFDTVPFTITAGSLDFVDNEDLNIGTMLDAMEAEQEAASTACPAPGDWLNLFNRAEKVIAITISSHLSGSYESACVARNMVLGDHPEKQVHIVDSLATGPEAALCIELMMKCIREGNNFEEVVAKAEAFLDRTRTVFALSSFKNLVKNGRMPKIVGLLAGKLGVWGIGIGSNHGDIIIKGKARGAAKAIKIILDDMFQRGYNGGRVLISHSQNLEFAQRVSENIKQHWQSAHVDIIPARGLDSFYAERGGIIIGY